MLNPKKLTIPQFHQKNIALSTLKMSKVGARISGGMNHTEAIKFLTSIGYTIEWIKFYLVRAGHNSTEIQQMLKEVL